MLSCSLTKHIGIFYRICCTPRTQCTLLTPFTPRTPLTQFTPFAQLTQFTPFTQFTPVARLCKYSYAFSQKSNRHMRQSQCLHISPNILLCCRTNRITICDKYVFFTFLRICFVFYHKTRKQIVQSLLCSHFCTYALLFSYKTLT